MPIERMSPTGRPHRTPKRLLPLLVVSSFLLHGAAPVSAQIVTDDAGVSTAPKALDSNLGTNPNLAVSSTGIVYVRFDLASSLPSGTPGSAVERATLRLFLANVTSPGILDVYALGDPWLETTITGRNAPPLGALVTTTDHIALNDRGHFLTIDVTPLVQQWLGDDGNGGNGLANHGLAIATRLGGPEVAALVFDSKENSQTSHEPLLDVRLLSDGASGIASISANSPLTVSDPTTTPTISLGIVPVTLGGTGLSAAGTAGNVLRSSGGVWMSAPLLASDVPAGSGAYIQNGVALQAGSNFHISGAGVADLFDAVTQVNLGGSRMLGNAGVNNVFVGIGSGAVNTGTENTFVGRNAGNANVAGRHNTFVGNTAGSRNTTGNFNSFFGSFAGVFNNTGAANAFFGVSAGNFNTSGFDNAFFGAEAGSSNTTGERNTFVGRVAGLSNTTGIDNSFVGANAGRNTRAGSGNVFVGRDAGIANVDGNNNTALGALTNVATGNLSFATAIGAGAVVASSNTVVLGRALDTVRVPGALSANILDAATQFNLAGERILVNAGTNVFVGIGTGAANTGSENTFVGRNAGNANTTGTNNTFVGNTSGSRNTTGNLNAFFGSFSGFFNDTGVANAFFGAAAGTFNTSGFDNSLFGAQTGQSLTTGDRNSFFGRVAGFFNDTGSGNSFFGADAGKNNTAGSANTFIGRETGFANVDGSNNTALGAFAAVGAPDLTFATAIGSGAIVNASNTVALGRPADTVEVAGALTVAAGSLTVGAPGAGVILRSPDGATCGLLSLTNAGALTVAVVACP